MVAVIKVLTGAGKKFESTMNPTRNRLLRSTAALFAVSLLVGACSSDPTQEAVVATTDAPTATTAKEPVTVLPDYTNVDPFVVNVRFTDEGFEPATIHVPAGRQVKLVLRNHGRYEHHYRVVGLQATDIRWYQIPEVDEDELLATESEGGFVSDIEHILHHLTPEYVPFKAESRLGIRPLATEVHGYAHVGDREVLLFYPLRTGSYVVEDVAFPEFTGKLVVFEYTS
jgi:hypothetical protein